MNKAIALLALAAPLSFGGVTLAHSAAANGDETAIVHGGHHRHYHHHTQARVEPPGGTIQDKDERQSNGKNPEALTPAK